MTDRSGLSRNGDRGIRGPARQIRADPDNNHPVATLRDAERLGPNYEVGRLHRFLEAGFAIHDSDGTQFVVMIAPGTKRRQILHQHLEDQSALDCRREHALDVFHHEGGGAQFLQHPDVFAKKVMPVILFGNVVRLATRTCPSD